MTIKELCTGLPRHLRSRIVNALAEEWVDTVDDLRAFLGGDRPLVLDGMVPGLGRKCARTLDQLVPTW